MYLIAACLPRLRPLIIRLHSNLSASLLSLMGRYYKSGDPLPSATSAPQELNAESPRRAPRIDVKLTGKGKLDSLLGDNRPGDTVSGHS